MDEEIDRERESVKAKGRAVSSCMLQQHYATAAGVGVGLAVGLQKKSLRSFVIAITMGTLGDWLLGYTSNCKDLISDYKASKKAFDDKYTNYRDGK